MKLAILLTYEGNESILYHFIEFYNNFLYKYKIDLYVAIDRLSNEHINVINSFNNNEIHRVFYYSNNIDNNDNVRVPDEFIDNSCPDYKLFIAQLKLSQNYDYIWSIGIGRLINIDSIFNQINKFMINEGDLGILSLWNNRFSNPYDNCKVLQINNNNNIEFYENFAWFTTMYGATIISSKLIKLMNNKMVLKKYLNSGFLYNMSIYEYLAYNNANVYFISVPTNAIYKNIYRKNSDWLTNSDGCKVFAKNWCLVNDKLPSIYENAKKQSVLNQSRFSGLFEKGIRLRASGSINLVNYFKYYKYIKRVTNSGMIHMFIICLIPKFVCKFAILVYSRIYG